MFLRLLIYVVFLIDFASCFSIKVTPKQWSRIDLTKRKEFTTGSRPPYTWRIVNETQNSTNLYLQSETKIPMVEVLSPDPGIYVLRVIWHPVFVNFNGRLKTGLYSLTESQNFTMLVDYKLPNLVWISDFGSLVYICNPASILAQYREEYHGGPINHYLMFNGSVKYHSLTEEIQLNFSDLGRHNLTIISRNLAWTQVHHLGVVEVTDIISDIHIRSVSTSMQVNDCRSLSVYRDEEVSLPTGKLSYSWIVESKTVNFNVTTSENVFSFCPQQTGDYRVLCLLRMKTFCNGEGHEISGKSSVLKIKVLDISNDDPLVSDQSFNSGLQNGENLLEIVAYDSSVDSESGDPLQMGKRNRSNVSCFCPLTVHQPEKGIQGCGLDDGNRIEALALSNCDVESSKCFKDTIFVVNIRTQHPTRASWSVPKSMEAYVSFLYYGKHANNNYVHVEVSVDLESDVLPLIISVHPKSSNIFRRGKLHNIRIDNIVKCPFILTNKGKTY
ncbi:uncharacterized protein LOC142348274 [Convolutriloba macropyga]|uniref:uncharacterized protein LOC142348274 n=1 Tax=Convolutriloba macropyga TaxID=536237 RepID=UPI003F5234AA